MTDRNRNRHSSASRNGQAAMNVVEQVELKERMLQYMCDAGADEGDVAQFAEECKEKDRTSITDVGVETIRLARLYGKNVIARATKYASTIQAEVDRVEAVQKINQAKAGGTGSRKSKRLNSNSNFYFKGQFAESALGCEL